MLTFPPYNGVTLGPDPVASPESGKGVAKYPIVVVPRIESRESHGVVGVLGE